MWSRQRHIVDTPGYLSEMDHLRRNQIVALAGLAPFNRDSGKKTGEQIQYKVAELR